KCTSSAHDKTNSRQANALSAPLLRQQRRQRLHQPKLTYHTKIFPSRKTGGLPGLATRMVLQLLPYPQCPTGRSGEVCYNDAKAFPPGNNLLPLRDVRLELNRDIERTDRSHYERRPPARE